MFQGPYVLFSELLKTSDLPSRRVCRAVPPVPPCSSIALHLLCRPFRRFCLIFTKCQVSVLRIYRWLIVMNIELRWHYRTTRSIDKRVAIIVNREKGRENKLWTFQWNVFSNYTLALERTILSIGTTFFFPRRKWSASCTGLFTRIENKILSLSTLHFSFYRPSGKLNFVHLLIRKANFFLLLS